ncbi:unnamed protein product [Hermetia illucens]|uniref:Ionotropic receptor n=1 Tax=Hermetia illucens TaxID=343691 RepID=A0A7R8YPU9_HERIL|nr:unnamed protein product [Hermetia illucens]
MNHSRMIQANRVERPGSDEVFSYLFRAILEFYSIKNIVRLYTGKDLRYSSNYTAENFDRILRKETMVPSVVATLQMDISTLVYKQLITIVYLSTYSGNLPLNILSKTLSFLYESKILFVLMDKRTSLQSLFQWCWLHGMVNVLVYEPYQKRVFTYFPFSQFRIAEVPYKEVHSYFPEKLENLHGLTLTSPVFMDLPRVFKYQDKFGRLQYGGYLVKLIFTFLQKYNGTFREFKLNNPTANKNIYLTHSLLENGTINFSIHASIKVSKLVEMSEPVAKHITCVVLPTMVLSRRKYFDLPFSRALWICIGAMFSISFVLRLIFYIQQYGRLFLFQAGIDTLKLLLQQQFSQSKQKTRFSRTFACLEVPVLILGLILNSLYQSKLTSFLIKFIEDDRISTWDSLRRSKIKIGLKNVAYDLILQTEMFPLNHLDSFINEEASDINIEQNLAELNTNFGYFLVEDQMAFLDQQQKHAPRQLFYATDFCISAYEYGFALKKFSPILYILNKTIKQISESGLIDQWIEEAFHECREGGLMNYPQFRGTLFSPLSLDDYGDVWIVFLIGLIVSTFVFVGEMFVWSLQNIIHSKKI